MRFGSSPIEGVLVAQTLLQRKHDKRGYFVTEYNDFYVTQLASAFNPKRGTFRGLHYQRTTSPQVKLIRCTRGAVLDVLVDMRPESKSYLVKHSVELNAGLGTLVLVPPGVAHGYLTLQDDSEVLYLINGSYDPKAEAGVRWCDPKIKLGLPFEPTTISQKDMSWPLL